jgi:CheY-like chemotaxis protein
MMRKAKPITILMADDDADDRQMTREAFEQARVANDLRFVENGAELMDYLHHRDKFKDPALSPPPGLILLDLNMPQKDGREALREIKADPRLKSIRIVVMTTSTAEEDVCRTYQLGAESFITKPVTFSGLVDVIQAMGRYWLEIVELPRGYEGEQHA